ncbi:MAG TPA: hypothetical protein VNW51_07120 [Mucilaginibacter sp.]|nr:hypothetical protein [Mucilaginibacter sp.]
MSEITCRVAAAAVVCLYVFFLAGAAPLVLAAVVASPDVDVPDAVVVAEH